MRSCFSLLAILAVLAGCQGPVSTGGFNQSPYRDYGVDGPGPGVIPDNYRPTSMPVPIGPAGGPMAVPAMAGPTEGPMLTGMRPAGMPMMRPGPTSQVDFRGLESLTLNWDEKVPGSFDSEPLVCPATHDFVQGMIYRMKLSNIPGRPGRELYPTLEIAPTMARTQAFLAHNSIPVEFTDNDFDQVLSGNFITKVIYLPNPEYQGLAMAGVGTLVNTQLEPGVDPIVEASNRGAILAVIRMGNKDLSGAVAERQRMKTHHGMMPHQMAYPTNGGSIPQNAISGVNIPPYGTPITKTTMGVPGPPQLPQGMHSPNRYPVVRTEPVPAPPTQRAVVGVVPQNVMLNPQYATQMQAQSQAFAREQMLQQQMQMQANEQPMPTAQPTLADPQAR